MEKDLKEYFQGGDQDDEVFESLSLSGQYNDENLMNFAMKKLEFERMVNKNQEDNDEDEIIVVKSKKGSMASSRYESHAEEDEVDYEDEEDFEEEKKRSKLRIHIIIFKLIFHSFFLSRSV